MNLSARFCQIGCRGEAGETRSEDVDRLAIHVTAPSGLPLERLGCARRVQAQDPDGSLCTAYTCSSSQSDLTLKGCEICLTRMAAAAWSPSSD